MCPSLQLAAEPESPRTARRFVADHLRSWDYAELVESAALLASELATNAVRHAGTPFTVEVGDLGHGVEVSVSDPVSALPVLRTPSSSDEGGRGMRIIDTLADRWGVRQVAGAGKVVWCRFNAVDRALV